MNREHIEYAIELMRNAKNLNMEIFQNFREDISSTELTLCHTVDELHACGSRACFAGYLAVSPLFQEINGPQSKPYPVTGGGAEREYAVEQFLGCSYSTAHKIVYGYEEYEDDGAEFTFYPVEFREVKPEHVIEKLEMLLNGELV